MYHFQVVTENHWEWSLLSRDITENICVFVVLGLVVSSPGFVSMACKVACNVLHEIWVSSEALGAMFTCVLIIIAGRFPIGDCVVTQHCQERIRDEVNTYEEASLRKIMEGSPQFSEERAISIWKTQAKANSLDSSPTHRLQFCAVLFQQITSWNLSFLLYKISLLIFSCLHMDSGGY